MSSFGDFQLSFRDVFVIIQRRFCHPLETFCHQIKHRLRGGGEDFFKEFCFINLIFQKWNPKIKFLYKTELFLRKVEKCSLNLKNVV